MRLLCKMAWRNLWRNRKRTLITAVALVFAHIFMIVYNGFARGAVQQVKSTAIRLTVGDFQLHHPNYLKELSLYDTLKDPQALIEKIRTLGLQAAPHWYGYGLMANDRTKKTVGVEIQGIDAPLEATVSDLPRPQSLKAGHFLSPTPSIVDEVVIGRKVADSLGAVVGDTVILVTTGSDGSVGNELFTIKGIFGSVGEIFDRTRVVMHRQSFMQLFSFSGDAAHEIVIRRAKPIESSENGVIKEQIRKVLGNDTTIDVKDWSEVVPLIADMLVFVEVITTVITLIVFLSAGLVILNSILMMVFERIREFGIMKAIGLRPGQIVMLVAIETLFLTVLSIVLGLAGGYLLNHYLAVTGIDLSHFAPNGFDFSGTTMSPIVRSITSPRIFVRPTFLLLVITSLSSLYPAIKAARLQPITAIQTRH